MLSLWSKIQEEKFFLDALKSRIPLENLFYKTSDGRLLAYWEKKDKGKKDTIQGRNSHIGRFTEEWATDLFTPIAKKHNAYAISNVACDEIALPKQSAADVAICKTNSKKQKPEDILMIIEVKMSIVWNWQYHEDNKKLEAIGDYNTHKGTPSLLRSDSMLKAIGKSTKIRFSNNAAYQIPIIILGNTPIQKSYEREIDAMQKVGIFQGFWSVNPFPLDNLNEGQIKNTAGGGFITFNDYNELEKKCDEVLSGKQAFLHGMLDKKELGKIIESANNEIDLEAKAEKLLKLLEGIK